MNEYESWSELFQDLEDLAQKIKGKISQEELVEDLKLNLSNTLNSTTELLKSIVTSVETTIRDDEIKHETKEIFLNISEDLKNTANILGNKFKNVQKTEKVLEEE